MSLLSFPLSCILLFLAISGYAHGSKQNSLSKFAQKVLDDLPSSDFDKLFNVNFKDQEEFVKVVENGADAFAKAYGKPIPDSLLKKLDRIAQQVNVKITPKILFAIFGNGVSKTLKDNGMLTKENNDELAEKFAGFLKKAADSVQIAKFSETEPVAAAAVANYLKSLGMPTEKELVSVQNNLFDEAANDLVH